jgi:hypothetical protein
VCTGKANDAPETLSGKETIQIESTWEYLRRKKWIAVLPLLTISTVKYDTRIIPQLMTEYLQDLEFDRRRQVQTPNAPYALRYGRLNRDGRFCVLNGYLRGILLLDHHDAVTVGHRRGTKTIKNLQNE